MTPVFLRGIFPDAPPPGWEEGLLFSIWQDRGLLWDIWVNLFFGNRFNMLMDGLYFSMRVAVFGAMIGWLLGFILALLKISKIKPLRAVSTVYISVIRGIPLLVQLMIWWFVIFATSGFERLLVCIIAFGASSGAYVAEIFRAGILSVDKGQTEAGRSVGLSSAKTMILIIFPQAFKNALPALINDFIILFKDTSVVGFIGAMDFLRQANHITSLTFNAFVPLFFVAIVFWCVVQTLTVLMSKVERRLRQSDSR
jgi:His/Glu/Gln/Arg/opine family amino acid ABC transporter permease subunit